MYGNYESFYDSFKKVKFSLSSILQKLGVDASCIFLGIDEVNKVYDVEAEQRWKQLGLHKDIGKNRVLNDTKDFLLSGLFRLVGRPSCEFSPFFVPVLAGGTVIGPMKSAVRESTHPPLQIPLPLLSFESCLDIFEKMNAQFSQLVRTCHQLRQLISYCGGHCRTLEILYNCFLDSYNGDVLLMNWKYVSEDVRSVLTQRYAISTIPLGTAIARSFLYLDVQEKDAYPEMVNTSYQDLESRGLVKLVNGKIVIPYFFVCVFLSSSKVTVFSKFWKDLLIAEGNDLRGARLGRLQSKLHRLSSITVCVPKSYHCICEGILCRYQNEHPR